MKTFKRILRITAYVATLFLAVMIILAAITQTEFFKDRIRILIVSSLSTQINGSVRLGTLGGNFITGFSADSLEIYYQDNIFLKTGRILCQYDPLTLLEKKAALKYFIIDQPRIHLVRSANGEWNFSRLMKPAEDTTHGTFDWTVLLADLQLKNGILTVFDSTSPHVPETGSADTLKQFDYGKFSLKDINVQVKATIKNRDFQIRLVHTSFYSDEPPFEVTHCAGEFLLSANGVFATNVLVQTSRSYVELDGAMHSLNVFTETTPANLQHDSTLIKLKAKNIDFTELKTLIPALGFLDGSALVDLAADGEYGDLTIKRLNISALGNSISVSGTVRDLQRAEKLDLDVFVGAPSLTPANVSRIMPGLGLPKFDRTGRASLFVQFAGRPLDFRTKTILKGGLGDCEVSGTVNLERRNPTYDLSFTTARLDLAALTGNPRLKSVLSSKGQLIGEGISLDSLNANLTMRVDSSRVRNILVDAAHLSLRGRSHRVEGTADVAAQSMKATLSGHVDFTNPDNPGYGGDLSVEGIDLGRLLDDPTYASDITARGTVTGSGKTIDNLNGDARLTLMPSTFQGHAVSSQEVHFFLDQSLPESKRLSLESEVMDLDLKGKFDLDLAWAALVYQTDNLFETIQEHALPPESLRVKAAMPAIRPHSPSERRLDFDYTLRVKDLEPVSTLLGEGRFDGRGLLSGAFHGTDQRLSFSCNGTLDEFYLGSFGKGVLLNQSTIALDLDSLTDVRTLDHLSANLKLKVGNGVVNGTNVDSFDVAFDYHRYKGRLTIKGVVDSLYSIVMAGQTSVQPHTYAFDVDSLTFTSGGYSWRNDQDVQFRLNYDGTRVMHALMVRNEQQFSLTGVLHHTGGFDFDAVLNNYDLGELAFVTRNPGLLRPDQGFLGHTSATLHLAGSPDLPVITFKAMSDSLSFRGTRVGSVAADISYRDSVATIDLTVKKAPRDTVPSLVVKGTLPVNLAFGGVTERFPDEEQHIQIQSKGFDLQVLDPLLREFQNLQGILLADISLAGTPREPEYEGSITLTDLNFTFAPNNVPYSVSATLEPARNKIILKDFVVRNLPAVGPAEEARVTGFLSIRNYQIDSMDLDATGQILLMSEATQKTHSTIYGALPTDIGADGLHLRGSLQHPYLSGSLFLQGANLTSPPVRDVGGSGSQLTLNYVVVDDTTKAIAQSARPSKFYAGKETKTDSVRPVEKHAGASTFLDRLRYDLSVETRGRNAIKMIFTPSTNEELYAELDGKVGLINNQGYATVSGEVTVNPNSYYNFFRRFDASGKLKFVGQWDNPELEIVATYEGYRSDPAHDSLQQKVIVQLNITGTRYEPKLEMSMKVQLQPGEDPVDWSTQAKGGDVQSDAISFILTGKFRDDLTSRERGDIATTVGSAAGSGFTTGLLSGALTDFLRQEFPFIRSADVSYQGGNVQQGANVRLSGEAFKGYWQVGGKILNDIGNANVSYSMSLGDVLKASSIHNLFLEIQRRVEGDLSEERKLTNEARLFYRFSF